LVGNPKERRPLEIPRHRLERLREMGLGDIDLAQDRNKLRVLVNTGMNLRVPSNVGKFLSSCTTGGFSRRAQLHGVSYGLSQFARFS
jgi:hypothetical protein